MSYSGEQYGGTDLKNKARPYSNRSLILISQRAPRIARGY